MINLYEIEDDNGIMWVAAENFADAIAEVDVPAYGEVTVTRHVAETLAMWTLVQFDDGRDPMMLAEMYSRACREMTERQRKAVIVACKEER